MNTKFHHNYLKSILSLGLVVLLGCYLIARAEKSRSGFKKAEGTIVSLSNSNETFPSKDTAKFRYLKIDSYPKLIELFIGESAGDFKPKLEKIDALHVGDSITIYYDENIKTVDDPVNRLVYYIDRGQEVIFIKGSWEKYLGYFLIAVAVVIFMVLQRAKAKGTIV